MKVELSDVDRLYVLSLIEYRCLYIIRYLLLKYRLIFL